MDLSWLIFAFLLGFCVMQVGLPPLVGYLIAGFVLHAMGAEAGPLLATLSEYGILLLLFGIGLKLSIRSLLRPYVWGTTTLHMLVVCLLLSWLVYGLNLVMPIFTDISVEQSLLAAFALSFSSTVFAVKVLDEKGETSTLHGKVAIGVLVTQDIFAVVFISVSAGKLPEIWAIPLLLGLWPLRWLLFRVLQRVGHGELLLLFGLVVALGGAEAFKLVGLKPDLGALVFGVLLATHAKSSELSKQLLGFKDLFLVGFFLSIGMGRQPEMVHLLWAFVLVMLIFFKGAMFFYLLTRFRLRARSAILTSFSLMNYSEFGLIVAAVGVETGMLPESFLIVIALAVAMSFIVSAPLNIFSQVFYGRFRTSLKHYQTRRRLEEDRPIALGDANALVFGMGRVGTSTYDALLANTQVKVLGIDFDREKIARHVLRGRNVVVGDATDVDFWHKLLIHNVDLVLLTMPNHSENLNTLKHLKDIRFKGKVAVSARYEDQLFELKQAGADAAYNVYAEAGNGFAAHVQQQFIKSDSLS